jgi:hypothetical protein
MIIQAEVLPLTHHQHLNFEFAHILMFTTAIVYAKEIFSVSHMLHGIKVNFEAHDNSDPDEVLKKQLKKFGDRTSEVPVMLHQPVSLRVSLQRKVDAIVGLFSPHEQKVTFKALKFHFLGFNGLLGTRFSVSEYIERCTEKHVGDLIDIEPGAWGGLLAILCVGLAGSWLQSREDDPATADPRMGTALFILWGFLLMSFEILLLMMAKANLGRMLEQNHHIRTSEEGDRWEEYDEHQAILESELRALNLAVKNKKEATEINGEMTRAKEMYWDEVQEIDKESAERLETLETFFQMVLLLQSMLQSLILLMLARNCIVLFDWWPGLLVLVLTWLPTELMTFFVTPTVLAQLSLAYAIGVKNKEVLEEMMEAATAEGDYAAAGQVLELAMTAKLSQDELSNEEVVREKVKDLLKLGELKWRYRVVDEGQNPRDEAIKVLDEANQYVLGHIMLVLEKEGKERDQGWISKHKEENWAAELSEVCQGLALSRLIFNGNNREEDDTIADYLRQALKLRQTLKDKPKIADTQNSLGALAQKQKKYEESEGHYKDSLETREKITATTDKEAQEKEQFLAQSYVSLGNLYLDMGEFAKALENLTDAKGCYVRGFNPSHPKVAWAVEAQANVHKKMKNLRLAQACIDEAIQIRRALQEKGDGKALFSKELEKMEGTNKEIVERRSQLQNKFKSSGKLGLDLGKGKGGMRLLTNQLKGTAKDAAAPTSAKANGDAAGVAGAAGATGAAQTQTQAAKPACQEAKGPSQPTPNLTTPSMPPPSKAYIDRKASQGINK